MIDSVLLYGSRARREGDADSDTDLMGISTVGRIEKTYDTNGLSFHVYPFDWIMAQCAQGTLFMLHIKSEAVAVFDPRGLLEEIRKQFQFKSSYRPDIEVGARVVMAMTSLDEREFNDKRRARYFWGLRTALMAAMADEGSPAFAGSALEAFAQVDGLATHIRQRGNASLDECREFGKKAVGGLRGLPPDILTQAPEDNLEALLGFGGIASATAGPIVYGV